MKAFNIIFLGIILFVVNSCATKDEGKKIEAPAGNEPQDLVNSFDMAQEQVDNFKTQPIVAPIITPPKEVSKDSIIKVKTKKEIKKKEVTTAPTASTMPVAVPVSVLPEGYPELFKNYDLKSQGVWSKFSPVFFKGEELTMAVTYLGVTAGHITISSKDIVSLNNKVAFHYFARFKSNETYSYFYWLDDRLDSFVEKEKFLPIKYMLIQREKKQNVDDLQLFDFNKMMTYNWYKRTKKNSDKNEKGEQIIPRFAQDSFSVLQFVRGLPLAKGDIYEFPIITRGKIWVLKVEVLGEEMIEVGDKEIAGIKVRAETQFPGVLKKAGDTFFWYGTGPEKRLLKFQAKIKIGSIYGELVDYKSGIKVL